MTLWEREYPNSVSLLSHSTKHQGPWGRIQVQAVKPQKCEW